jgi:general secretion pathway protein G
MAYCTSNSEDQTNNVMGPISPAAFLRRRCKAAHRHAGFTIVELIIVLAILMTICAIAIPNLWTAMNSARNAKAVADVHSISTLVIGYAAANNAQFPNSLADIDCDQVKDPWGNPYQYLKLTTASTSLARQNGFGVQVNELFDLYSLGPDGLSSQKLNSATSQDDIVWANDGGYIGAANLY